MLVADHLKIQAGIFMCAIMTLHVCLYIYIHIHIHCRLCSQDKYIFQEFGGLEKFCWAVKPRTIQTNQY